MPTRTRSVKTDVLAHVPLFAACTSKELALIASITDEVDVAAGHVLAREGAREESSSSS